MTLNLQLAVLLGILSATIHWILARSVVMRWFWSRARGWFGKLLACPACSGWWISLGLGALGMQPIVAAPFHWQLGDLALIVVLTAVLGAFLTPVFQAVLLWGLAMSAIEQAPSHDDEGPVPTHPLQP